MIKFRWLDPELEQALAAELANVEDNQEFLEHFFEISLLLEELANDVNHGEIAS